MTSDASTKGHKSALIHKITTCGEYRRNKVDFWYVYIRTNTLFLFFQE